MNSQNSDTEHQRLQRLGDLMSELQERCWSASWMCATPQIVSLCRAAISTGEAQPWGMSELTPGMAREMWTLAESLGAWAELADTPDSYARGLPFTSIDRPDPGGPYGWDPKDP
jgi:hypothetical protein